MHNKVYVVIFNDRVSTEGYRNIDDAIQYCEDRAERQVEFGWKFKDNRGNTYTIREIKII